jgi:hypothetical protein
VAAIGTLSLSSAMRRAPSFSASTIFGEFRVRGLAKEVGRYGVEVTYLTEQLDDDGDDAAQASSSSPTNPPGAAIGLRFEAEQGARFE